jgi:hypothetical protein
VRSPLNVERTSSRALHIDEFGVVDLASFSSSDKKWYFSGRQYANSISETCEDVALASTDGIVDNRATRDRNLKLQKRSFRRWVLKDRFSVERNISKIESVKLDE